MRNPFKEWREYHEANAEYLRQVLKGGDPSPRRKRPPYRLTAAYVYVSILAGVGLPVSIYFTWPVGAAILGVIVLIVSTLFALAEITS